MKKVKLFTICGFLLASSFAYAETSIDDMENMDGSKLQPSNEQIQQQRQNAARVEVIKKCSSFVPESGKIDQDSLDKIRKCLADNNGYMPKEYQFTPQQSKPVNDQQLATPQAAPQPQINEQPAQEQIPQTNQQQNTPTQQQDSSQQNLGPSYLR